MLIDAQRCGLLIIDFQEKLLPAINDVEVAIANSLWLMRIAQRLHIPMLLSEQYPQGLGSTLPEIRDLVSPEVVMSKVHFSCTQEPDCKARLNAYHRDQWIVIGIEAHICVLQTALGLRQLDYEVYVVADCTSSRQLRAKELAIARMQQEGVRIVNREMVVFEWLQKAGTDTFREISRAFLR